MTDTVLQVIFKGVDQSLSKEAKGIGGAFSKLGGVVKTGMLAGIAGATALGTAAIGLGSKLIGLGSDAEEMQSKFNVVFANVGGEVTAQLDAFAAAAGRSKFELRGYAATMGDTLKPMGFTEEAAGDLSVQLVELATDLGSFNNMPMDEALQRLQGTLIGSHENALAFGVIINENTLKAELAANGWDKLTGAELEQAKVQARINLLMAGTTDAQGDAIRTADGWANSTRALTSKIQDFATEIGMQLLPVFTPLLGKITDLADEWLPKIGDIITGTVIPAIQGIISAFQGFFANLSEGMTPIDAFIEAIWDIAPQGLLDKLVDFRDNILPGLMLKFEEIKTAVIEFITPITDWIAQNIELKDALIALGVVIGGVILSALVSLAAAAAPVIAAGAILVGLVAGIRTAWEQDFLGIRTIVTEWAEEHGGVMQGIKDWWENLMVTWNQLKVIFIVGAMIIIQWIDTLGVTWDQLKVIFVVGAMAIVEWVEGLKVTWNQMKVIFVIVAMGIIEWVNGLGETWLQLQGIIIGGALLVVQSWENFKDTISGLVDQIKTIWEGMGNKFAEVKDGIISSLQPIINFISGIQSALDNLSLPEWMQRHSPSPIEQTFMGWRNQMQGLVQRDMPALNTSLQGLQTTMQRNTTINQNTTIYTSSVDTRGESQANMRFATGGI